MSEEFILCTRCHSEGDDGKDHESDLACALKWREIAAQAFTPVMIARMKVARCRRARHQGHPVMVSPKGESTGYCTRCVAALIVAFKMIEKWVGFFSSSKLEKEREGENGTEGHRPGIVEAPKSEISPDEGAREETGREPR